MTVAERVQDTILTGYPVQEPILSMEEVIRPFEVSDRGLAFIDGDCELRLSYADFADLVEIAGARLRAQGVEPGAFVATTLSNELPSVLALLGIWAAGATVISLPPPPNRAHAWYAQQYDPVLEAMGCTFFIGDEDPEVPAPAYAGLKRIAKAPLAEPGDEKGPWPELPVPDTALIQFTSGSVGTPKGVAIKSTALAGHLKTVIQHGELDSENDKLGYWLPLYHDMGLISLFLAGLMARMDQVIAPPASFAIRPASWLTMLSREQATYTAAPNFAYRLAAAVPYEEELDLSRVRSSLSGGERLDWQTLQDFHAVAGPMGFKWGAIMPAYGLAENTVGATCNPRDRGPVQGPDGHVSVGVPLPGTEVRGPDGDTPGPIYLRGDHLFSGYHTVNGFEPLVEGEWYDTGDDGFIHDGELYVLGRRAEVLTMAGRNVFAEDVESIARDTGGKSVRACAAFRNMAVTGRFGLMVEADPKLVKDAEAAHELARLIQTAVTETLGTRLTPVLVVRLGTIPRTTSGKVQRAQCRSITELGEFGRRLIAQLP